MATDYYQTLNVSPNATAEEIKKAYRKLALQNHPDVAGDGMDTVGQFQQIKTAYDVLGNIKSRQTHHYKHFYTNYKTQPIVTANGLAIKAEDLALFTAALDPYRLDHEGLFIQIFHLINTHNLRILLQSNDGILIRSVIINLLKCAQLLPFDRLLSIHQTLLLLADKNQELVALINKKTALQKKLHYWEQYKFLLAMVIALALCVTIFFLV